jgi:uncharacterized protein YkwD
MFAACARFLTRCVFLVTAVGVLAGRELPVPTNDNTGPGFASNESCPSPANNSSILEVHNAYRARHHAQPLVWDAQLEAAAADWAARCVFTHSYTPGQGENLYAISQAIPSMGPTWLLAAQTWYNEISLYSFANAGFSPATGHLTQMLWQGTKMLGCAVQRCYNGLNIGYGQESDFVVCRYSPPGNVLGQFSDNVLPP